MSQNVYNPFILAPPFTSCETAYLVFGDGEAPYTIYPIASGSPNATALEFPPQQRFPGVFQWHVDFDAGTNLTWTIRDARGREGYSGFEVVRPNAKNATCPRNNYNAHSHTARDAGIGAAVGAVVLIVVGIVVFYLIRRQKRMRSEEFQNLAASRNSSATVEMGQRDAGTTSGRLVRHGTFNLHGVQFNDESHPDAPPQYVAPAAKRRFANFRSSRPSSRTNSNVNLPESTAAEASSSTAPATPEVGADRDDVSTINESIHSHDEHAHDEAPHEQFQPLGLTHTSPAPGHAA